MEKRKIKVLNEMRDVSLLGFGCMRLPQIDGEIDIKEAEKIIADFNKPNLKDTNIVSTKSVAKNKPKSKKISKK